MKTRPFNAGEVPLTGTHLVEASAGTGKTYSITALVLRLVVELGLTVEQILVVTFTNAATAELKDRIRKRLRQAQLELAGDLPGDDWLRGIVRNVGDPELVRRRVDDALRGFDGAAVFTIHGFCRRVLQEHAFESGSLFDTELVTEQTDLVQRAVDDFWRARLTSLSPGFIAFLEEKKASPDGWRAFAAQHIGARRHAVVPGARAVALDREETACREAEDAFRAAWLKDRDAVGALLLDDPRINRQAYRRDTVTGLIHAVDVWAAAGRDAGPLPGRFDLLTATRLAASLKKGCAAPDHVIFALGERVTSCRDRLAAGFRERWIALRAELLDAVEKRLAERKAQLNVQFFDDLLTRLDEALAGAGGSALAARIRAQYPAALIDEFQDTDPVQYRIFKTLYGGTSKTCLFLVGDPKQSIYAFRGADIFSYLQARTLADSVRRLTENWRSCAGLVTAVGTLFGRARRPFLFASIEFRPSTAAAGSKGEQAALKAPGGDEAPLQIWFLARAEEGRPINKGDAEPLVLDALASEAARLIEGGRKKQAFLGEKPVEPGDIAVLVRTHRQAAEVKAALAAHGVAGVMSGERSVFASDEAAQLEKVLHAVARPADEGLVRGALITPLYGLTAHALLSLQEDAGAWDDRAASFAAYHRQWRDQGFVQMFRRWLTEEQVPARLLGMDDGERRLTNLLHLGELIEKASLEHPAGPEGLVGWLSDHREERGEIAADEAELRLESDARRVRIVTIHKSKGLEYPIVFCPFAYEGGRGRRSEDVVFHDREHDHRITLDLGSEAFERNAAWAAEEDQAEQLRLLYVAVTRASHRCYLAWGRVNQCETSPLGYLLHQAPGLDEAALPQAVADRIAGMTDAAMREDLECLRASAPDTISVRDLDTIAGHQARALAAVGKAPKARIFTGRMDTSWRVASFTALASGRHADAERPDRDPQAATDTAPERPLAGPHALPGGVATGTLLHKVFEDLAFDADEAAVQRAVARRAAYAPLGPEWQPVLSALVLNALHTPLDDATPALTLARVPRERRLDEVEFHYPLGRISPSGLDALLPGHAANPPRGRYDPGLVFDPVHGFMKGYIDLVFEYGGRYYLADYKSNRLGEDIDAYAGAMLPAAMAAAHYDLQYHLYAVALHRHLAARLAGAYRYRDHFGGVFYLFLRGLDPARGPTHGVFFDRPDPERMDALSRYLEEGETP